MTSQTRNCGTCTRCCEGWLDGEAHGYKFFPGRPCHFLNPTSLCTIYEQRPNLCQQYNCEWLLRDYFPEWMKPEHSNVIVSLRDSNGFIYYYVRECGKMIDSRVLSWLVDHCLRDNKNMAYQVNGTMMFVGSAEFMKASEKYKKV
jgi:hypothetical protein